MKIISEQKNNLLKRRELSLILESEKNPGFDHSLKNISSHFKVSENQIAIKSIKSRFGQNSFLINAFIYDAEADKIKNEPKPKIKEAKK